MIITSTRQTLNGYWIGLEGKTDEVFVSYQDINDRGIKIELGAAYKFHKAESVKNAPDKPNAPTDSLKS